MFRSPSVGLWRLILMAIASAALLTGTAACGGGTSKSACTAIQLTWDQTGGVTGDATSKANLKLEVKSNPNQGRVLTATPLPAGSSKVRVMHFVVYAVPNQPPTREGLAQDSHGKSIAVDKAYPINLQPGETRVIVDAIGC